MKKDFNVYSIHYSCNSLYGGGTLAPTICCISLCNIKTKEMISFSIEEGLKQGLSLVKSEEKLLEKFTKFGKKLENPFFAHWEMNSLEFGFKAIIARCENFGIEPFDLNNVLDFNLSGESKYYLKDTLELIGCKKPSYLTGKQEAACFDKREFSAIKRSTESKASGLAELFVNYTEGAWIEGAKTPEQVEKTISTPTAVKLYKLLNDLYFSHHKIEELMNLLKTDEDKLFLINTIEKKKSDNNLLELLAYEYMNKKRTKRVEIYE